MRSWIKEFRIVHDKRINSWMPDSIGAGWYTLGLAGPRVELAVTGRAGPDRPGDRRAKRRTTTCSTSAVPTLSTTGNKAANIDFITDILPDY